MSTLTIHEYLTKPIEEFPFFDWFCNEYNLYRAGVMLTERLADIAHSKKFDSKKDLILFKNNCVPEMVNGKISPRTYSDFRICDAETGDVKYTVAPRCRDEGNKAVVYGRENEFKEPLVIGTWTAVRNWFLK